MTKEKLKKYRAIISEIRQIEEEIDRIESTVISPPGKMITDMPLYRRNDADKIGDAIANTEELKKILYEKRTELLEVQIGIEKAITNLEPTERMLCRYRYIDGMKWDDICIQMSYSWNKIHSIHRKALESLKGEEIK